MGYVLIAGWPGVAIAYFVGVLALVLIAAPRRNDGPEPHLQYASAAPQDRVTN